MSHAAQQLRDWFVTAVDAVVGVPTPTEGKPRQVAIGSTACYVTSTSEDLEPVTIHGTAIDLRNHVVSVVLLAATLDAVDALSVLVEEGVEGAAGFPGKEFNLFNRIYEEDVESDRTVVALTLQYACVFYTARDDVETFK